MIHRGEYCNNVQMEQLALYCISAWFGLLQDTNAVVVLLVAGCPNHRGCLGRHHDHVEAVTRVREGEIIASCCCCWQEMDANWPFSFSDTDELRDGMDGAMMISAVLGQVGAATATGAMIGSAGERTKDSLLTAGTWSRSGGLEGCVDKPHRPGSTGMWHWQGVACVG